MPLKKAMEKIRNYYGESTSLLHQLKSKHDEMKSKLKGMEEAAKDIPSLL